MFRVSLAVVALIVAAAVNLAGAEPYGSALSFSISEETRALAATFAPATLFRTFKGRAFCVALFVFAGLLPFGARNLWRSSKQTQYAALGYIDVLIGAVIAVLLVVGVFVVLTVEKPSLLFASEVWFIQAGSPLGRFIP